MDPWRVRVFKRFSTLCRGVACWGTSCGTVATTNCWWTNAIQMPEFQINGRPSNICHLWVLSCPICHVSFSIWVFSYHDLSITTTGHRFHQILAIYSGGSIESWISNLWANASQGCGSIIMSPSRTLPLHDLHNYKHYNHSYSFIMMVNYHLLYLHLFAIFWISLICITYSSHGTNEWVSKTGLCSD